VDALVIKVCVDERVVSTSALIVSGINDTGLREVLVSDDHKGLKKAGAKHFQGAV